METGIRFPSASLTLEGRLHLTEGPCMIITHPHSLYGGAMDNPVVETIMAACRRAGYGTLRFNFRGVGESEGFFDQGLGEALDVRSAMEFLRGRGVSRIDLAGYSFGAWVLGKLGCEGAAGGRMLWVAPPVAFIDYDHIGRMDCLDWVIAGQHDEIGPPDQIRGRMATWRPDAPAGSICREVAGADHFFSGRLETLGAMLYECLRRGRPEAAAGAD